MPAAYSNLYIEQNADFAASISINDVFGNIYGLIDCVAYSQIRKSYYSANSTAEFSTTLDPGQGVLLLQLNADTTANIAAGRYVYDALIVNTVTNERLRLLEGVVDVSPCVSR